MTAYSKKLIIFDKDGTLSPSKEPIDHEMAELLTKLLEQKQVAITSGSGFPLFETQILKELSHTGENLSKLYILPVCGAQLYAWKGSWQKVYSEDLSQLEKDKILSTLRTTLKQAGFVQLGKTYGDIIEDRGSQITFSALGQGAPILEKATWDPHRNKREYIVSLLQPKIPEFDVRIGGTTSIDITKKGVNKGYGIRRLEEHLKIPLDQMIFVGDALFQGGNDYPAKATGIDCISVAGPEETKKIIHGWVE